MKELQKENDTLSDRIGRVIDFSSLQADTTAVIEDIPSQQLVGEALSKIDHSEEITVSCGCESVKCDVTLMSRAIIELLRNALAAKGESEEPVSLSISEKDDSYEIQIVNSGRIPKDMDVDFFEPWARGDWSRTSEGSGLGLPIVSAILALHRGTVSLRQITPDLVGAIVSWPKA